MMGMYYLSVFILFIMKMNREIIHQKVYKIDFSISSKKLFI